VRVLAEIPEEVTEILASNPKIGRKELSSEIGISEMEARFYLRLWRNKIADSSPKSLGMQEILKEQNKKQTKIIKELRKIIATDELLLEGIREIAPAYPIIKSVVNYQPSKKDKIEEREAITIWSDWHAGERVYFDQMEGLGEYNFDILCGRAWDLIHGIIRIVETQKSIYDIDILNIDILGDQLSGEIHEELLATNEFTLLETCYKLSYVTVQAILMLLPQFKKIRITGLPGNHPRLYTKPQYKNRVLNNYDTLHYHLVSMFLSNYIKEGFIEFNIPKSPECILVRKGWAFLLGHSDQIKGWNGIPWYGFQRDNAKQQKIRKQRSVVQEFESSNDLEGAIINFKTAKQVYGFDYREAGHWHTMNVLDDWGTVINGSLLGGNEYSLNKLHAVSSPKQALMFLSERWGLKGIEPVHCVDKGHKFKTGIEGTLGHLDL
jgi:hypothetical protein